MVEQQQYTQEKVNEQVTIKRALPKEAEVICNIRDEARIAAYTNPELGYSEEQIRLNCCGVDNEFVPRRIAYLQEKLANETNAPLTTFVAEIDGKVVGYVEPAIDEHGNRRIDALYVSPDTQSAGIGTKLLTHALNTLGRNHDIHLEVVSYNQRAIKFYEKFGFVKTDRVIPEDTEKPDYVVSLPETEMVLKKIRNN